MFSDLESEWSKAFGEDVEIYELSGERITLFIGGVFHGLFSSLTEVEWELDNVYNRRDEGTV